MTSSTSGRTGSPGWIVMRVADTEYALPIAVVREVVATPEIARVPMAPSQLAGVAAVRDEVMAVVDLGMRLRQQSVALPGRLVVVTAPEGDEAIGLLVDAVDGLLDATASPANPLDLAALLDFEIPPPAPDSGRP